MTKREKRAKLADEMRRMNDALIEGHRDFTDDEKREYEEKEAELRNLSAQIAAEERKAALDGFTRGLPAEAGKEERAGERRFFEVRTRNGQVELRTSMQQGTEDAPGGGYAVAPEQFYGQLEREIEKEALLYARVSKIPVSGHGSLGLPYEKADADDAEWTQEVPAADIEEDKKWDFGKRELSPNNLTKLIKISKQLLVTSALPMDSLAREKVKDKLVAAFEQGIISGDGNGKPLGIFTASDDGVPASRDVQAAGADIGADDLMEVYMSLRPAYRRRAVWVMSTAFLKAVMKLKDADGQYLWHESIRSGEPSTLLGLPVLESEYAPSVKASGAYALALCDLSHYKFAYWKGLDVTIANELFAGRNQVGFFGHTLADGMPTLPSAFARLKLQ